MKVERSGVWQEAAGVLLPDGMLSAFPLDFVADYTSTPTTVYSVTYPAGVSFVNDPILGAARKVMKIVTDDTINYEGGPPPTKVRVQCQTPFVFGPGHDVFLGLGVLFPTGFPTLPADGWMNFHEFHGPPFAGGSPNAFDVKPGDLISYGPNSADGTGSPLWTAPLLRNTWIDLVLHIHFSRDPMRGSAEIWMNTGSGYVKQTFRDGSQQTRYASLSTANYQGFCCSMPKSYHKINMPGFSPLTTYYAGHKLGSSFAQVAPASH